jgi:uncharacterized caspase-like protein
MSGRCILALIGAIAMTSLLDEAALAAESGRSRLAVVVSNGDYVALGTLRNPIADGRLVASSLRAAGFNVTYVQNLNDEQFRAALRQIARDSATAEVTLIYYAGHGAQIGGINYLLPVDVPLPEQEDDIRLTSVSADDVLSVIKSPYKILVLDACRDNPNLARALSRGRGVSFKRGLATVEPPAEETGGVFIAYSTQTDAVALDGEGANSPFAESFAQYVGNRVSIDDMFAMVTRDVLKKTNGSQRPFKYASLDTVYCLTGACSSTASLGVTAPAAASAAAPALTVSAPEMFAKLNAGKSPAARLPIENLLWQQLRAALPKRVIYGRAVQDGKTVIFVFEPATAVSDGRQASTTVRVGGWKDGSATFDESESADLGIDCDRHAVTMTKRQSGGAVKLFTRAEQNAQTTVLDMSGGAPNVGLVEALCMAPLRFTPLWALDSLQWVSIGTGYDAAPAIYYKDPSAGEVQDLFVRVTISAPNINGVSIHYQWLGINCRTRQFEDSRGFGATADRVILTVYDNKATWSPFKDASPEANAYVLLCDQPATGH